MKAKIVGRFGVFLCIIIFICSCSKDRNALKHDIIDRSTINEMITSTLESGVNWDWNKQTNEVIYSAGQLTDSVYTIGYTIFDSKDAEKAVLAYNIEDTNWKQVKDQLDALIVRLESRYRGIKLVLKDLKPYGEVAHFPQLQVQIANPELIEELRRHPAVRFVEPMAYYYAPQKEVAVRDEFGCDGDPNYNIHPNDYSEYTPGTKVGWNHIDQSIPLAWNTSTGNNVKICIIDSGVSIDQDNVGGAFNQGDSFGRSLERYSTLYQGWWWWKTLTSPYDECGHGTAMSGLATAPRGVDGNACGVAYNADLMSIKAVEDVVINTTNEKNGVRDALYMAANSNTKIISMSIGTPFYSSTVADGVIYAYSRQKLIFAAAGTSSSATSWYPVIFPASMSQTTACTGVRDLDHTQKCTTCHSGSQVVFTAPTQRSLNTDRLIIGLAMYSDQPKYTGASSGSTATTAGIAALVWAKNPNLSRSQVLDALKEAAEFYGNEHPSLGYGVINAQLALGSI